MSIIDSLYTFIANKLSNIISEQTALHKYTLLNITTHPNINTKNITAYIKDNILYMSGYFQINSRIPAASGLIKLAGRRTQMRGYDVISDYSKNAYRVEWF